MQARKLTLVANGVETEQASPAVFQRQMTSSGHERLLISVPQNRSDLFQSLTELFPPPYFILYILHTPRGEGEPGRYQSTQLGRDELRDFLERYRSYLAGDARHDVWVHSPSVGRTLIWDRHNQIYAEGQPLDDVENALASSGFRAAHIEPLGGHIHHYRSEFDADAVGVLKSFDWYQTPLRSEDEQ